MTTTHSAFFYGTLMAPAVLSRVIHGTSSAPSGPSPLTTRPALLPSHRRHRVRFADYPAVVPVDDGSSYSTSFSHSSSSSSSSSVRGVYVTGLSARQIECLDVFEGDEYERRAVTVRVLEEEEEEGGGGGGLGEAGAEVQAETYIWVAGAERLEDAEWDFEAFVREKMCRWVGGVEMAEVDEHHGSEGLDGTGGRGANGHITHALKAEHAAV